MGVTEYETRQARITDAFVVAIKIGNRIKSGSSFHTTLAELDGPFERLTDRYHSGTQPRIRFTVF